MSGERSSNIISQAIREGVLVKTMVSWKNIFLKNGALIHTHLHYYFEMHIFFLQDQHPQSLAACELIIIWKGKFHVDIGQPSSADGSIPICMILCHLIVKFFINFNFFLKKGLIKDYWENIVCFWDWYIYRNLVRIIYFFSYFVIWHFPNVEQSGVVHPCNMGIVIPSHNHQTRALPPVLPQKRCLCTLEVFTTLQKHCSYLRVPRTTIALWYPHPCVNNAFSKGGIRCLIYFSSE